MKNLLKMKEPVNTLTHFIPFLAAIFGLLLLELKSVGNPSKLITMTIYGLSLIALYGASSIYHWWITSTKKELLLRKLDHAAIYLLIAGSYTPVFYYGLSGVWKWTMLASVWTLALFGIALKMFFMKVPRSISTAFYVTLGWIAIVPFVQLIHGLPVQAVLLMIAGGIAYTIGAVIYATKWLNFFPNHFGFHEIFHLFVVAGSLTHFIMIDVYVSPL